MSIRAIITGGAGQQHAENVLAAFIAGYAQCTTGTQSAFDPSEALINDEAYWDGTTIEQLYQNSVLGYPGAVVIVRSETGIADLETLAALRSGILSVMPLGSNSHDELTALTELGVIVACGGGVTQNETGYGAGLEFWDSDLDGVDPDLSSYSTGRIAGKLLRIYDELRCSWEEVRMRARATASNGGVWDAHNGYGRIDVDAALAYVPSTVPVCAFAAAGRVLTSTAEPFVQTDQGRVAQFYGADDGVLYFGTVSAFVSAGTVVLDYGVNLPQTDLAVVDIALFDADAVITVSPSALVSLADVKAYLGADTVANDAIIQGWINDISTNIEDETNTVFAPRVVTDEIRDGNGASAIDTLLAPVLGPKTADDWSADLWCRTDPMSDWEKIEDVKQYVFVRKDEPYRIGLYRSRFPYGTQNIRISYTAGMAVIPADIKFMCIERVVMLWNESKQGNDWLGKNSVSVNRAGATDSTSYRDMQERWRNVITQYRRAL